MEIKIDKSFRKDTRRIKDKNVLQRIANTIANVQRAKTLEKIRRFRVLNQCIVSELVIIALES
jgi:hypothetical protein